MVRVLSRAGVHRCVCYCAPPRRALQRMVATDARDNHYDFDDFDDNAADEHFGTRGSSAAARAAQAAANSGCEAACRAGLALDGASAPLRELLQELRDDSSYNPPRSGSGFGAAVGDVGAADAALRDADAAAKHKAVGNGHFGAKDYTRAEEAFTAALAWDPCDHIFYSNRSASRAALNKYRVAFVSPRRSARVGRRSRARALRVASRRVGEARASVGAPSSSSLALPLYRQLARGALEHCGAIGGRGLRPMTAWSFVRSPTRPFSLPRPVSTSSIGISRPTPRPFRPPPPPRRVATTTRHKEALADADACVALAPASFAKGHHRRAVALCGLGERGGYVTVTHRRGQRRPLLLTRAPPRHHAQV